MRLRECRWPALLRGGSQEVYRGKMGGHKSASVVEQSSGAGISGRLALHSRSILPDREDQECHHSVSGAASPPQTAARFWVFAYPARGTTQTSTSAGHCGQNWEKLQWKVKRLQNLGRVWSEETPTPPVTVKRPLAGSESMDTTALGAITPTQVQDNNQGPTQVSLSPRSQRMDTLQPPQSPVLADVVSQLHVLMASVQSTATTVGQLGGQLHSLQTQVTVMKNADNEDDEFEEHDGFSSELGEKERGGHGRCPWRAKIQHCQTYAVLSGEKERAVFKASRRVFVAFSSFAVLFCSARSSPTVNVSQVFARKEVQFSEKCCLFFVVSK